MYAQALKVALSKIHKKPLISVYMLINSTKYASISIV